MQSAVQCAAARPRLTSPLASPLQAPARAGIVLFTKQECFWWIVAWWAMNYCPGDLVARLHALLPVRAAARVSGSSPTRRSGRSSKDSSRASGRWHASRQEDAAAAVR